MGGWGSPAGKTEFTYPFLGGFPSKILIHVPVRLPLPMRRGQRHPIQRPVLEPTHIAARPAVARQERLAEAAHRVPALGVRGRDRPEACVARASPGSAGPSPPLQDRT